MSMRLAIKLKKQDIGSAGTVRTTPTKRETEEAKAKDDDARMNPLLMELKTRYKDMMEWEELYAVMSKDEQVLKLA